MAGKIKENYIFTDKDGDSETRAKLERIGLRIGTKKMEAMKCKAPFIEANSGETFSNNHTCPDVVLRFQC